MPKLRIKAIIIKAIKTGQLFDFAIAPNVKPKYPQNTADTMARTDAARRLLLINLNIS